VEEVLRLERFFLGVEEDDLLGFPVVTPCEQDRPQSGRGKLVLHLIEQLDHLVHEGRRVLLAPDLVTNDMREHVGLMHAGACCETYATRAETGGVTGGDAGSSVGGDGAVFGVRAAAAAAAITAVFRSV
jgi:hypothetical protein